MKDASVEARALAALDRRLASGSEAPLAVAVSGGGDSVALLLLADAWSRRVGRALRVLTVDHGLDPESGRWASFVSDAAARLGRPVEVLRWTGEKSASGLPAAAREARHGLLADAARAAGAAVVLTGHTVDDVLEGEVMRAEGASLGRLREWAPSPAWPQGRGVFLLRPLLSVGRAELRAWLRGRGEGWIEDPANDDLRFGRARARARLSSHAGAFSPAAAERSLGPGARQDDRDNSGLLRLTPEQAEERSVLAAALVSASGGVRPPRAERLDRLVERLRSGTEVSATLAGARLLTRDGEVLVGREPGRAGLSLSRVLPGERAVWDGRFELNLVEAGEVRALAGSASRLGRAERDALQAVPAPFRPTLPVVETSSGAVFCPLFTMPQQARSLVRERWFAACGGVRHEREIGRETVNGAARAGALSTEASKTESVSG
jgi:tRNA(Ile)-lysidine synthase